MKYPATNWKPVILGSLISRTTRPRQPRPNEPSETPFLPMELLPAGRLETRAYELRPGVKRPSGNYFEEGDLLLARITPCFENGKQAIARSVPGGHGFASTEILPLKIDSTQAQPEFIAHLLTAPSLRAELAAAMHGATGRRRLPREAVDKLRIALPPRPEQRRIAAFLTRLQRRAELERQRAQALAQLKAATLAKLFREGLHGEPLKDSPVGPIPQSWGSPQLAEIASEVNYGTSVHCTPQSNGTPVLRIPNVTGGRVSTRDMKFAELKDATSSQLAPGDILFVRTNGSRNETGRCAVYHGEPPGAHFASYLIRVRLRPGTLNPDLAANYLNANRGQVTAKLRPTADGKFNLDSGGIRSLRVPLPGKPEQRRIQAALDPINRAAEAALVQLSRYESLFRATLERLMTGALRLPPAAAEEVAAHA